MNNGNAKQITWYFIPQSLRGKHMWLPPDIGSVNDVAWDDDSIRKPEPTAEKASPWAVTEVGER